jgi:hypothetical protein
MLGAIDLTHTAHANLGGDFIGAEVRADYERQGLAVISLLRDLAPGMRTASLGFDEGWSSEAGGRPATGSQYSGKQVGPSIRPSSRIGPGVLTPAEQEASRPVRLGRSCYALKGANFTSTGRGNRPARWASPNSRATASRPRSP